MDDKENNEELRPTKMRGVAFPKAKYGVIAAIIIIVVVNLIYYKDFLISLLKRDLPIGDIFLTNSLKL